MKILKLKREYIHISQYKGFITTEMAFSNNPLKFGDYRRISIYVTFLNIKIKEIARYALYREKFIKLKIIN